MKRKLIIIGAVLLVVFTYIMYSSLVCTDEHVKSMVIDNLDAYNEIAELLLDDAAGIDSEQVIYEYDEKHTRFYCATEPGYIFISSEKDRANMDVINNSYLLDNRGLEWITVVNGEEVVFENINGRMAILYSKDWKKNKSYKYLAEEKYSKQFITDNWYYISIPFNYLGIGRKYISG